MAKIICDKKKYIIGAHIVGAHAADIIHELAILKQKTIPFDELHKIIHIYPTYAELLWHLSKKSYVDTLQSKWIIRLLKKVMGKK
jgi:pyruvate/2-oxoglutarate dehydrogenase complex dihydrolipoamide dehydrogenase (E3) component